MKYILRYFLTLIFISCISWSFAQTKTWREIYKVKKKDTIFGIARKYDISIMELMDANPDMKLEGYSLKKGDNVYIPYAKDKKVETKVPVVSEKIKRSTDDIRKRAVHIGIMLPLHDADGDGKRMVEYYRGILMACDSLKKEGISTTVSAWNIPQEADITQTLATDGVKDCDIIFGPLYTRQVKPLAGFCKKNDIMMVVPFSTSGNDIASNPEMFQVYQSPELFNDMVLNAYMERFSGYHAVFVDCNDTTSKKGVFTYSLRKRLESKGLKYSITNLKSSEVNFAKAFSRTQPNIVILNTGRSPELNVALAKLDGLKVNEPSISISLFGYTEWLMYTKVYLNYFYKYDAYIPTSFYYNAVDRKTQHLENGYRHWFKTDLQYALPRFAVTGYDHANFFIRGLHLQGKTFSGSKYAVRYKALQTPLNFKKLGSGGGAVNRNFMLIHYDRNQTIESITY